VLHLGERNRGQAHQPARMQSLKNYAKRT
jgi:hypothetical protein